MTENETELNIYFFITKQYDKMHKDLQKIGITVSFDMGWQKRSGGHIYDSLSGHGYFLGCLLGNVVYYGVIKKNCSMCDCLDSDGLQKPHICNSNWYGSRGSMESGLALKLIADIFELYNGRIFAEMIISDDASTKDLNQQT